MHQGASSELSKTFHIFHHKGDPCDLGGLKSYPNWKKRFKKNPKKRISNQDAKLNKKMGGRSFVITCGVIGTLYSAGRDTCGQPRSPHMVG